MQTLCFDLTRRCNLACKFCARGPAQNQDISKEVIDATLDQMKGVFIWSIRFSGGEPLLNPFALDYVIDGIIKRNLAVCHITIFSNGTIYDNPQIDAALKRAADYLHTRNAEQTNPNYHKTVKSVYAVHGLVDIIVSDYGHLNAQHVDAAVNHYRNIGPYIEAVKQTSAYKGNNAAEGLVLYGSAIDHARELVKQPVTPDNVPPAHHNEYSFIVQPGLLSYPVEPPHVTKSITVSTNGIVFPGCMQTYERIDAEADYNILDGEDLFAYLEEYCWQHPATKGMNKVKRNTISFANLPRKRSQGRKRSDARKDLQRSH